MEEPEQANSDIGLEERSGILQAWNDFKDAVFNVLFVILDKKAEEEEEESLAGLAFQSGLDYLQMLAFPFHRLVINAWNGGDSLSSLANFFNQFSIGTYLPGAPFSAFLAMLYGLIFIILLIIVDIIYVSYSFSKKKFRFTFPLVILAQVVPLFVTVLFLPITETLLNVVQCSQTDSGQWTMTSFPEVQCWAGWHLFHTSITLLFAALFVLISTVVALALFQPRMTAGKLTARTNSNGQVVFILNKIVLQFIFTFSPFDGTAFYVTVIFLLAFWQFWCYFIKNPHYSRTASKFFKICSTYYFWTALMLFVGQVLGGYGFDGALVVWMSGLPFFALIIYFDNTADLPSLFASNLKFKSGEQLEAHISYVLQLVNTHATDKNSYMLLIGYIEKHKQVCNEADCPLKSQGRKRRGEEGMEYNCQMVFRQMERMFRAGVKKFSECTKLRVSYAFFQLEQMRNKEKAYEEFSAAARLETTFQQQFTIYRFKKIIRENLEDREEADSDLIETIRYENYVSLLEEAMVKSAKLHKDFWTELKEEVPDLKKLNQVGGQITSVASSIAENYRELSKINSSSCQILYSYGKYLLLVSEDYAEGREMLANARKIFLDRQSGSKHNEMLHFNEESYNRMTAPLLVLTAASPAAVPRITGVNLMFTEVTGYQKEELLDHEVSKIAPRLWTSQDLTNLEMTQGQQCDGYLNHKFNHLLPVSYSVIHRQEEQEWHLVFKLSATGSMKMVMLVDLKGAVTDCNLLAQTALNRALSSEGQNGHIECSLADIGLSDFANAQFRRPNGSPAVIRIGERQGQCMVQVEPITVRIYGESGDAEDEEERMVMTSEKHIGFRVIIARNDHGHLEMEDSLQESSGIRSGKGIDAGVLELYENRSAIDDFMGRLAEEEHEEDRQQRFVLRQKIKTMRLLDNEIKMVYSVGVEGDYSDTAGLKESDDERELFKFDDEGYQAKLRAAINTNLNHVEVVNLRRASCFFLLLLFLINGVELFITSVQVDSITSYIHQITQRCREYSVLTSNVMAIIDPSANYSALYQSNSGHQVSFETDLLVSLQLENNLTVVRNLKDAVVLLHSRLLTYFHQPATPLSVSSIFNNYITAIFPLFYNYPGSARFDLGLLWGLGGLVLVMGGVMMGYWIYISLLIDKKRYDIMIWFLDIPVNYVSFLGSHCDKFIKEFMTTKELARRGISTEDQDDSLDEYSTKKHENDDEEIEEQIKARKSLISKNKKETLISKVDLSSLKVVWLLVFALAFSVLVLVKTIGFSNDFNFMLPQWRQTSRAVIIDSTLYLALQMKSRNISAAGDLTSLISTLQMDHKGVIAKYDLQSFNFNILSFHLNQVTTVYNSVYFSNLCLALGLPPSNLTQCQAVVGSKLKTGYEVYSKYLIAPEPQMIDQIWLANQLYVIPALLLMLWTWEGALTEEGSSIVNLCSIVMYVFVILSVIGFLLLWLYYLRILNTSLNQTIQMLNMIPFKLLPKSRKETKLFIAWIIREANKTNHDSD